MKKKATNNVLQLLEAFIMHIMVFLTVFVINEIYAIFIPMMTIRVFWTWQFIVYPPILFFLTSKLWYLKFSERHSFVMIVTAFLFAEYAIYNSGGLLLLLKSFYNEINIILGIFIAIIYLSLDFVFSSVVGAMIHSLFFDRLRRKPE